jgi:hypothetical protein
LRGVPSTRERSNPEDRAIFTGLPRGFATRNDRYFMDIISHALWTNLIFKELPLYQRWLAIAFGVLPDLISFSSVTFKHMARKLMHHSDPPLHIFPKIVFKLYNITHSLVVWLFIFMMLKIFNFDLAAFVFMGWGLHILLDIFTHSNEYFPTPILWPLSKFHFSGINWSNPYFMLFNYLVIVFFYLLFYI